MYTSEQLSAIRTNQKNDETDFKQYALPQLPDTEVDEVYEQLLEAERVASPELTLSGYDDGSASVPDELLRRSGSDVLLSAEHATTHWRLDSNATTRRRLKADFGTAALGITVQAATSSGLVVPIGRQTGDANHDVEHSLKDVMKDELDMGRYDGHFSLHGINLGRVASLSDKRGFNAILGVGAQPDERTLELAHKIVAMAKDYDLRVGINQPVMQFEMDGYTPKRKDDGSVKTITFAAKYKGTTRTFVEQYVDRTARPCLTMQLEIGESLRVIPYDHPSYPGKRSQRVGAYLGYTFVKNCAALFTKELPVS